MSQIDVCPKCKAGTRHWWSYCAMCGWHIASGEKPGKDIDRDQPLHREPNKLHRRRIVGP